MSGINNEAKIKRNRVMTLLTVDVLSSLIEMYEYVKSDNLEDPHMPQPLKDQVDKELEVKLGVLKEVLQEETETAEGFDVDDLNNYGNVVSRIDEVAGL